MGHLKLVLRLKEQPKGKWLDNPLTSWALWKVQQESVIFLNWLSPIYLISNYASGLELCL